MSKSARKRYFKGLFALDSVVACLPCYRLIWRDLTAFSLICERLIYSALDDIGTLARDRAAERSAAFGVVLSVIVAGGMFTFWEILDVR